MSHLPILGFALAVLTATGAAQDTQPHVKHFHDRTKSTQSLGTGKTPASTTPEANLRRLEQQATKLSAPPRVKRTPARASALKTEKEKPTPPIRVSGPSHATKGLGTNKQSTNPYRGRLRQKGSQH